MCPRSGTGAGVHKLLDVVAIWATWRIFGLRGIRINLGANYLLGGVVILEESYLARCQ